MVEIRLAWMSPINSRVDALTKTDAGPDDVCFFSRLDKLMERRFYTFQISRRIFVNFLSQLSRSSP